MTSQNNSTVKVETVGNGSEIHYTGDTYEKLSDSQKESLKNYLLCDARKLEIQITEEKLGSLKSALDTDNQQKIDAVLEEKVIWETDQVSEYQEVVPSGIEQEISNVSHDAIFWEMQLFGDLSHIDSRVQKSFSDGFGNYSLSVLSETGITDSVAVYNKFKQEKIDQVKLALTKYASSHTGIKNTIFTNQDEATAFFAYAFSGVSQTEIQTYLEEKEQETEVQSSIESASQQAGIQINEEQKEKIESVANKLESSKVSGPFESAGFWNSPIWKIFAKILSFFWIDIIGKLEKETFTEYKNLIHSALVVEWSILAWKKVPQSFMQIKWENDTEFMNHIQSIIGKNKDGFQDRLGDFMKTGGKFEHFLQDPAMSEFGLGNLCEWENISNIKLKQAFEFYAGFEKQQEKNTSLTVAGFVAGLTAGSTDTVANTPSLNTDTSNQNFEEEEPSDNLWWEEDGLTWNPNNLWHYESEPADETISSDIVNQIDTTGMSLEEITERYVFEDNIVYLIGPDGTRLEQTWKLTKEQQEVLAAYESTAILWEVLEIWIEQAEKTANSILTPQLRDDDEIIKENIAKVQDTFAQLYEKAKNGEAVDVHDIEKIWNYILAAETEESIIGENDMKTVRGILLNWEDKDSKLIQIYDTMRYQGLSGNSGGKVGVKEKLSNHLMTQPEFANVEKLLADESLYSLTADAKKTELTNLVGNEDLAENLISFYTKAEKNMLSNKENFVPILADINRQRSEQGESELSFEQYKQAQLKTTLFTQAKHRLLKHTLEGINNRTGNRYVEMYADVVGLDKTKWWGDHINLADEDIDTALEIGANLAVIGLTMGAGAGAVIGANMLAKLVTLGRVASLGRWGLVVMGAVEWAAFYEGSTIASNFLYGNELLANTTDIGEIGKAALLGGVLRWVQSITGALKLKPGATTIPGKYLTPSNIGKIVTEAGAIVWTSEVYDKIIFDEEVEFSPMEIAQALMMATFFRGKWLNKDTQIKAIKGPSGQIEINITRNTSGSRKTVTKGGVDYLVNTNGSTQFPVKVGGKNIDVQIKHDGNIVAPKGTPQKQINTIQKHVDEQLSSTPHLSTSTTTSSSTTSPSSGWKVPTSTKAPKTHINYFSIPKTRIDINIPIPKSIQPLYNKLPIYVQWPINAVVAGLVDGTLVWGYTGVQEYFESGSFTKAGETFLEDFINTISYGIPTRIAIWWAIWWITKVAGGAANYALKPISQAVTGRVTKSWVVKTLLLGSIPVIVYLWNPWNQEHRQNETRSYD